MDFKIGETVELNSGSPTMTIGRLATGIGADKSQGAWCDWFDQKNQPHHQWFPLTSLKKVAA